VSPAFPPIALLPCPFCGAAGKWFRTGRDVGVECAQLEDCHGRAQTDVYEPEFAEAAAGRWNTRNDQAADHYATVLETRDALLSAAQQAERWIERQMLDSGYPKERVDSPPEGSHLFNLRAAIAKAEGRT
jgi:Restriction alleviation protein Lar